MRPVGSPCRARSPPTAAETSDSALNEFVHLERKGTPMSDLVSKRLDDLGVTTSTCRIAPAPCNEDDGGGDGNGGGGGCSSSSSVTRKGSGG